MDHDRESPSSSPAPGHPENHPFDEEDLSASGEADAVAGPSYPYMEDQPSRRDGDLSVSGEADAVAGPSYPADDVAGPSSPSYPFMEEPSTPRHSPAPSNSGMDGEYENSENPQQSLVSFSGQLDSFSGSDFPPCLPSGVSSSSSVARQTSERDPGQSSFQPQPGPSRQPLPRSSDPVFSSLLKNPSRDLLPFPSHSLGPASTYPGDRDLASGDVVGWNSRNDMPMSSNWGNEETAPRTSDWDGTWAEDGPSDQNHGAEVPGPSGLEQAVPEQLPLDREDQDSRDLQWAASSSGMERHLDYSEDNSIELDSDAHPALNSYPSYDSGVGVSGYSPQPSSAVSTVSGSVFISRVSPLDPNLSSAARYSPSPYSNGPQAARGSVDNKQPESSRSPRSVSISSSSASTSMQPASIFYSDAPLPTNDGAGSSRAGRKALEETNSNGVIDNSSHQEDIEFEDGASGSNRLMTPKVASAKRSIDFPDSPGSEGRSRNKRHRSIALEESRPDSPSPEVSQASRPYNNRYSEPSSPQAGSSHGKDQALFNSRYSTIHQQKYRNSRKYMAGPYHSDEDSEDESGQKRSFSLEVVTDADGDQVLRNNPVQNNSRLFDLINGRTRPPRLRTNQSHRPPLTENVTLNVLNAINVNGESRNNSLNAPVSNCSTGSSSNLSQSAPLTLSVGAHLGSGPSRSAPPLQIGALVETRSNQSVPSLGMGNYVGNGSNHYHGRTITSDMQGTSALLNTPAISRSPSMNNRTLQNSIGLPNRSDGRIGALSDDTEIVNSMARSAPTRTGILEQISSMVRNTSNRSAILDIEGSRQGGMASTSNNELDQAGPSHNDVMNIAGPSCEVGRLNNERTGSSHPYMTVQSGYQNHCDIIGPSHVSQQDDLAIRNNLPVYRNIVGPTRSISSNGALQSSLEGSTNETSRSDIDGPLNGTYQRTVSAPNHGTSDIDIVGPSHDSFLNDIVALVPPQRNARRPSQSSSLENIRGTSHGSLLNGHQRPSHAASVSDMGGSNHYTSNRGSTHNRFLRTNTMEINSSQAAGPSHNNLLGTSEPSGSLIDNSILNASNRIVGFNDMIELPDLNYREGMPSRSKASDQNGSAGPSRNNMSNNGRPNHTQEIIPGDLISGEQVSATGEQPSDVNMGRPREARFASHNREEPTGNTVRARAAAGFGASVSTEESSIMERGRAPLGFDASISTRVSHSEQDEEKVGRARVAPGHNSSDSGLVSNHSQPNSRDILRSRTAPGNNTGNSIEISTRNKSNPRDKVKARTAPGHDIHEDEISKPSTSSLARARAELFGPQLPEDFPHLGSSNEAGSSNSSMNRAEAAPLSGRDVVVSGPSFAHGAEGPLNHSNSSSYHDIGPGPSRPSRINSAVLDSSDASSLDKGPGPSNRDRREEPLLDSSDAAVTIRGPNNVVRSESLLDSSDDPISEQISRANRIETIELDSSDDPREAPSPRNIARVEAGLLDSSDDPIAGSGTNRVARAEVALLDSSDDPISAPGQNHVANYEPEAEQLDSSEGAGPSNAGRSNAALDRPTDGAGPSHMNVSDHAGPSHIHEGIHNHPISMSWRASGPVALELGSEAAPARRPASPEFRPRRPRRIADQDDCGISSSTGPFDAVLPSPEEVFLDDLNNDLSVPSPVGVHHQNQVLHYSDDDDNMVDSTVDSTSGIPFMVPSPPMDGNEAAHEGDDSDNDMDTNSVTGSECSSTSDLHRAGGANHDQDDGDGISTSGQVDHGQFRLVPNDQDNVGDDDDNDEAMDANREGNQILADHVPDVHEDLLEDESIIQDDLSEAEALMDDNSLPTHGNTPEFKRPYNRKGRLLDHLLNYNASSSKDPVAGPSSAPEHRPRMNMGLDDSIAGGSNMPEVDNVPPDLVDNACPIRSQLSSASSVPLPQSSGGSLQSFSSNSSMPMPMFSTNSFSTVSSQSNSISSQSSIQSSSLFSLSSTVASSSGSSVSSQSLNDSTPSLFSLHSSAASSSGTPAAMGIGMAFSGLPVSLSRFDSPSSGSFKPIGGANNETSSSDPMAASSIDSVSGPLSKRLRTRHFQDIAAAEANQRQQQRYTRESQEDTSENRHDSQTYPIKSQENGPTERPQNSVLLRVLQGTSTKSRTTRPSPSLEDSTNRANNFRSIEYNNKPATENSIDRNRNNNQCLNIHETPAAPLVPSTSSQALFHSEGHLVIPRNDLPEMDNTNDNNSLGLLLNSGNNSFTPTSAQDSIPEESTINGRPPDVGPQAGPSTSRSGSFLGGTQQTYSMTIESIGPTLNAIKPKKVLQAKSAAEFKSLFSDRGDYDQFNEIHSCIDKLPDPGISDDHLPDVMSMSQLSDLPGLQSPIKQESGDSSKQPSGNWCDKCSRRYEGTDCPVHLVSLSISDRPVQSRAWASLPSTYLSINLVSNGSFGVIAKKTIPVSCRFGPVEGQLVPHPADGPHVSGTNVQQLILVVKVKGEMMRLDIQDEEESNWMRFVRPASRRSEQNLVLIEDEGNLFYTSTCVIPPRQELRVWYSQAYAESRGLKLLEDEDKPEMDDDQNDDDSYNINQHDMASLLPQVEFDHDMELSMSKGFKKNSTKHKNSNKHIATKANSSSAEETGEGGPGPYICHICNRKFEREASLSRHLALHKGEKKFPCEDCGQKFSHKFNLDRHQKKVHHSDPAGRHVRCPKCTVWFPSGMVLKVHMFSHHPNKEQQNWTVEDAVAQSGKEENPDKLEEMKFQCPCNNCLNQYDTWLELVEHTGEHGTPVLPGSPNNPPSKMFKCELCYKSFGNENRLQKHMAVHGGEDKKPLQCNECGKRFLNNSALAGHVKTHAAVDPMNFYDCPICLQEFETVSSLKDHVYVHRQDGLFTCPHCHKTFSEYMLIRKHIRAFHAEKRFPCELCMKSFTSQDKLKIHLVKHSNVREFMCSECGKQFKRKDKLREHIKRMHNKARKEKQTPQDAQAAKFVPKVSPTELHRFIYKCHTCMLGFKRRGMLVNHLAKRHPEVAPTTVPELNLPILKTTKDFYCQYCDKVYKSSSKRKAHIIKNHPGSALPAGARRPAGEQQIADVAEPDTFSQTVGSITTQPHGCELCHKQYASKAKLLQHMRKKHKDTQLEEEDQSLRNGQEDKGSHYVKWKKHKDDKLEDDDEAMQDEPEEQIHYLVDDEILQSPRILQERGIPLDYEGRLLDNDGDILTHAISINQLPERSRKDKNDKDSDQNLKVEAGDKILRLSGEQQYMVLQSASIEDVAGPSRRGVDNERSYNRTSLFSVDQNRTALVTLDPSQLCLEQPGAIIVEAPCNLQPSQLHQILESAGVGQGFRQEGVGQGFRQDFQKDEQGNI